MLSEKILADKKISPLSEDESSSLIPALPVPVPVPCLVRQGNSFIETSHEQCDFFAIIFHFDLL